MCRRSVIFNSKVSPNGQLKQMLQNDPYALNRAFCYASIRSLDDHAIAFALTAWKTRSHRLDFRRGAEHSVFESMNDVFNPVSVTTK